MLYAGAQHAPSAFRYFASCRDGCVAGEETENLRAPWCKPRTRKKTILGYSSRRLISYRSAVIGRSICLLAGTGTYTGVCLGVDCCTPGVITVEIDAVYSRTSRDSGVFNVPSETS